MANTQQVFLGAAPDDDTGDPARTAFTKYNTHAHPIGDVSGLQPALDAKSPLPLAAASVTSAMLRNSTALSLIGRAANSAGVPADIAAAAASGAVLRESGSVIGFGTVVTAGLADDAVTFAKLQNVSAAARVLGRGSAAGAGNAEEIVVGAGLAMTGTTLSASVFSDPAPALAGPFNLNAQTIRPGTPTPVTGARTYDTDDSGKTFNVTTAGTQTILAGLGAGWVVDIWNSTASNVTISGPGATDVVLAAGQVATVKFLTTTVIRVAKGDSTVIS